MDYVWPWFRAVGRHWKRELLGGALIGLLALISDLSGKALPPRAYEVCAVVLCFYAMFLAWRDRQVEVERLQNEIHEAAKRDDAKQRPLSMLFGETAAQRAHTRAMERLASEMERERRIDTTRPQFIAEVTELFIDADHQQPDWIKLYVRLMVRNQGADSAINRWTLKVVPPQPGTPFIQTEKGLLSDSQQGPGGVMGGNFLHDHEIIKRGGGKEGWLLCHGPKDRMGLTTGQRPVVKVSFRDVNNNEYSVIDPPNFNVDAFFNR